MPEDQADLFPPEPEPEEVLTPGTLTGDVTDGEIGALLSRVQVWCGERHGWRPLGVPLNQGRTTLMRVNGRFVASLTFDLGPPA